MSLQAPLLPAVVLSLVLFVLALTGLSHAQLQPKASVLDFSASLGNLLPSLSRPANSSRIFYGVMFDAGSTGTRIHVYTFIQKDPGHLYAETRNTVGILDLGGGSTQITFLPKSKKTIVSSPADYIARFDMFNSTYELYTHSYLGNGLMAARLAALGALGAEGLEWRVFKSACLPKKFREEWSFGGLTYTVSGIPNGYAGYKLCYQEVLNVVKGIVHQPYELKDTSVFYAFSYYFDRAVDAGLIDGTQGGMLEVRDFKKGAKEVCNKMSKYRPVSPFLCMDMTYITCLLKDGFGFKENTVLQLTKKVNNIETSWALGATFKHFQNLKIH